ncbi:unnamed protein product [Ectocarpus sp. CCAP 1310/34]|nr:unnamed protein product [Ectocarpus sp. CCAP 1310/34]
MELMLIARRTTSNLQGRGARVERVFCGSFMTSLDMAGASVTVMRVDALSLARCVRYTGRGRLRLKKVVPRRQNKKKKEEEEAFPPGSGARWKGL